MKQQFIQVVRLTLLGSPGSMLNVSYAVTLSGTRRWTHIPVCPCVPVPDPFNAASSLANGATRVRVNKSMQMASHLSGN